MNHRLFLNGIKNTLFNPVKFWDEAVIDNRTVSDTLKSIFIPLVALISVSALAGSLTFTNVELSPVYSLFVGIKCFCLFFCAVYVSAFILKEITYPLDLGRDFGISLILIIYSFIPFLICQIFSRFFESFLFVNIIGLYGFYIFWSGMEKVLNPPSYKKMPLLIAFAITTVVVYITISILFNTLTDKIFFAFFS